MGSGGEGAPRETPGRGGLSKGRAAVFDCAGVRERTSEPAATASDELSMAHSRRRLTTFEEDRSSPHTESSRTIPLEPRAKTGSTDPVMHASSLFQSIRSPTGLNPRGEADSIRGSGGSIQDTSRAAQPTLLQRVRIC